MVVQLVWLNQAFCTVPLRPVQWLQCVAIASSVLVYSECRKCLILRRHAGA